jgi:hypothetical protein
LKFYRGDAADGHCKIISDAEEAAKQLALDLGQLPDGEHLLRLVVATSDSGRMSNVTLIELDKNNKLTGRYIIPFHADTGTLPALPPPVDQGPPPITPVHETEKRKDRKLQGSNAE